MNSIIQVDDLSKKYDDIEAVNRVSFDVLEGEIFGLIGPDGAGKTSIFRIINTLLLPTEGKVTVLDLDSVRDYKMIRRRLGYMPQKFSLYQDLSVEENLSFFARIFGTTIKENYDLIKNIYEHIEPFKKRMAGRLSGGMKQKLALSCALIHSPEILILDEPTTGVDAVSRKEFWEMLIRLKEKGITILVSTPYMDEANLCDRVALIQKGRIMSVDTPDNIISDFNKKLFAAKSDDLYQLLQDFKEYENTDTVYPFGEYLHVTMHTQDISESKIEIDMLGKGHTGFKMSRIKPNIEDCFMDLMN